MLRGICPFVTRVALAMILAAAAQCQQDEPESCAAGGSQPSDVTLRLSLKNGQSIFRKGEIISLIEEYSSTAEKTYYLSTRNYDRSGRLVGMEIFCITPDTGSDPLADYFNGIGLSMGGGLGSELELGREAHAITLELNEWKSLPPGSYRLSVEGHRVSTPTDNNPYGANARPIALRSNEVEFQVIEADPAWQAEQLSAAVQILDSSDTGDEAKHAARVLRFLGSEASTRELAHRYWSGNDQPFGWDLKFGLFGSPYRTIAIEGMKNALRIPPHPVTEEFVQTLATLELESDPKSRLPQYDAHHEEEWTKVRAAYTAEFDKRMAKYMSQAAAAIQTKTGQARAVTVSELLQAKVELEPAAKAQLRQMLLSTWASLPGRRQNELIQYRWEQVGGPEWLPTLKAIVGGEPNPQHYLEMPDRGSALRRIFGIAPDQGRELILKEIANPKRDIGIDVLGLLPDRELPQIEPPILAKLKVGNGTDLDYQLLERYATSRAFPEIKPVYEAHRGGWACVPQTAMLHYFLRVQPEYGISQVSGALGERQKTGCYRTLLTGLEEKVADRKIERIAVESLNDPSVEVDADAAQALGKYGSARVEQALWARMEKFNHEWKDKGDELRFRPGAKPEVMAAVRLEQVLVQAIASGGGWYATEEAIRKLENLASPQMQAELEAALQEIHRGEYSLSLNWWPQGTLMYSVGRYSGKGMAALKGKLAQFPAGTHLDVVTTKAEREGHKVEFAEMEQVAEGAGLVLEIQTTP